ncbi:copper-translocating P-type ATPase [Acholeplasma equirhinis]|uniref:copper-translocating P-type ATPase n=1 Tax=Acholeplasma equirhinis TaxID=555393 RepID=UPI00197A79A4|nr:copper-translocating P-type ATPase [Acholeplasma equirhinis]MBN3490218.1 copper-translocating P-type ATPase [Acholeplasma equirhinis]
MKKIYVFKHHDHNHGSDEKKVCTCPGCKGEGTENCSCGCLEGNVSCNHENHHKETKKVCTCLGCEDAGTSTCECDCLDEKHEHHHEAEKKVCTCPGCKGEGTDSCTCGCLTGDKSCSHDEHQHSHHEHHHEENHECCGKCEHEANQEEKVCTCPGCKGERKSECNCGCLDSEKSCNHDGEDHSHHHHTHNHSHHNHSHHDHSHHGHHGHGGHDHSAHIKDYLIRFVVSSILSIPVLLLSPMIQNWLNYSITFQYQEYVVLIFATAIFAYGGWPFFSASYYELKAKEPAMMSLVALSITISYVYSVLVTFGLSGMDFYWELVTLIDIMLLGHFLEMKSSMVASDALQSLTKLLPSEAHLIINDNETKDVPLSELKKHQIVLVKPGEKVPVDGDIVKGESAIDESMVTGESNPVVKTINDQVIGGTINGDGLLEVKISKLGEETYLSQVVKLVNDSLGNKSKTQRLADIAAKYLFYVSITVALLTWLAWGLVGESQEFILEKVVTVIVIACPHALGVAIPLVTSISTTLAAKNGLLIKNRSQFENARKVTDVIFDKTGTLTDGKFSVTNVYAISKDIEYVLDLAYVLEKPSTHPIAKGILAYSQINESNLKVANYKNLPGYGVTATINGLNSGAVSVAYLDKENIKYDQKLHQELVDKGQTLVYVIEDQKVLGLITLQDQIKPSAIDAIKKLNALGIRTHMLTGDNKSVAEKVANELGITTFKHSMLPHEKSAYIDSIKQPGSFIMMTGDGINDAPALAKSDLGIAIGAGTDVAINTADIILVRSEPKDVLNLIELSKSTYRKMVENLIWALAYNVLTLPLAAGVLAFTGFVISPAVGAILMSLSTIVVSINAQFLKIKK